MKTRATFLSEMHSKIEKIESTIETEFYYLESEDLRFKSNPKQWSIVEVIEHLNLANGHYLKELNKVISSSESKGSEGEFKMTWLGKKMLKSMEPQQGIIPMKMKTFKSTDPLILQAKGHKLTDHIVFQDFMSDLKEFKRLIKEAETRDIQKLKIRSLISILKLRVGDALCFIIAHMERHLLQAQRLTPNHRISQ